MQDKGARMVRQLYTVDPQKGRYSIGEFRHAANARQRLPKGSTIHRHRHRDAYAAIVLSGGFEESGNRGRFKVGAGQVLLHSAFDTHLDRVFITGAEVLHLRLPGLIGISPSLARASNCEAVVQLAESDVISAVELLLDDLTPLPFVSEDWPDLFVAHLNENPDHSLEKWTAERKLDPEHFRKDFIALYGVSPTDFHHEMRARKAFEQIAAGADALDQTLTASGFSTKLHLSRAIKSLTGSTPQSWLQRATIPYFAMTE
jgi:AraC-like DNA-binding protein